MNPLIACLFALVANLVAGLVALRAPRGEARPPTLAGAAITLGAAPLCAVPLLAGAGAESLQLGPLALRADALAGTLLLPLALAVGALALALPRGTASGRRMAGASFALGAAILALVADNLLLLVLAEVAGNLAVVFALANETVVHRGPPKTRTRAGRIYLGLGALLALLGLGLAAIEGEALHPLAVSALPVHLGLVLLLSAMLRLGAVPFHSGLTATFCGNASPIAVLLVAPLGGVPLLVRAVQPALAGSALVPPLVLALLAGAMLAALLALVQRDLGRSAAWGFAAASGLVVAGNLEAGVTGGLGGELLWAAGMLSCTGFALAVIMVIRRLGAADLSAKHALQAAAPQLSLLFLVLALAIAGLPGTLEFIAIDVILSGAGSSGPAAIGLAVATIAAIGFNALRLSFRVFYGPPRGERVDMEIRPRQRVALLLLAGALLIGGVAPGLLPIVAGASRADSP